MRTSADRCSSKYTPNSRRHERRKWAKDFNASVENKDWPNAYALLEDYKEEHPMDTDTSKPSTTSNSVRIPLIKIVCMSLGEVYKKVIDTGVIR